MNITDIRPLLLAAMLLSATGSVAEDNGYNGSLLIDAAQIQAYDTPMLVDLLNKLPGVKASDGFISLQGSTTNEVLVLLDGRPLTDSMTGSTNLGGILTAQLASIEIIKGAGAAMYGDNTSGGVIIIRTKRTDAGHVNKFEAAAGTYDTQTYNLNVGHANNGTGIALTGSYERTDGYRLNGDSEVVSAKADLNHLFAGEVESLFSLNYTHDAGGSSGRITHPTPNARYEKKLFGSSAQLTYDGWKGRAYYSTNDDYNKDPDHAIETYLNTETIGGEVRFDTTTDTMGNLLGGISTEQRSAEATDVGVHRETLYGIYLIKPFSLWRFNAKAGLRVNHHSVFQASYNPELSLAFKEGMFKSDLKISRSAKTPTIKQRYYLSTTVQGNPDLRMEKSANYQLGLTFDPSETFNCRLNFFYSSIDNGITGTYNDADIYTYENISSSTRQGMESSFNWNAAPWLSWNASYLYLIFKNDTTGLYMPSRPKHKLRTDLYVQHDRFKGNIGGYYVSSSFNNTANTQELPSYFIADTKLSYGFGSLGTYVEVSNLFDRDYEVHVGYPAAGRSVLFGIDYLF